MIQSRNHALDGLRGVAALAVALSHCVLGAVGVTVWAATIRDFPGMSATDIFARLLFVAFPGDGAVTLFFVLSGHVLWESFKRNESRLTDGPDYAVSRAYRLLPVAIVSAIPIGLLANPPGRDLVANMLLLSNSLNGPLWSLQVEVLGSLAIFAAWIAAGGSALRIGALLALFVAVAPAFRGNSFFLFFPAFLLGALIAHVPQRAWMSRTILVLGVALLILPTLFVSQATARAFQMIGAFAVVGTTRVRPLPVLTSGPIQFLGAISYPFYLSHATGLLLASGAGLPTTGAPVPVRIAALALVSIPPAVLMAWFIHVAVEGPAMRMRPRLRTPHLFAGRTCEETVIRSAKAAGRDTRRSPEPGP